MSDDIPAWERQPYDTQAAWAMFQLYLQQDPPRSLLQAYRLYKAQRGRSEAQIKRVPGGWRNVHAGKRSDGRPIPGALTWEMRAAAWDDFLAAQERDKWVKRRMELREKEWNLGSKLLEKAQQMLMFPVIATESADGKSIIMPADWRFRDIPAILGQADKISRLAADLATENVTIDWRAEARKEGIDPDEIYRQLVQQFEDELAGSDAEGSLGGGETTPPGDQ